MNRSSKENNNRDDTVGESRATRNEKKLMKADHVARKQLNELHNFGELNRQLLPWPRTIIPSQATSVKNFIQSSLRAAIQWKVLNCTLLSMYSRKRQNNEGIEDLAATEKLLQHTHKLLKASVAVRAKTGAQNGPAHADSNHLPRYILDPPAKSDWCEDPTSET